jgi:hypothetical protein
MIIINIAIINVGYKQELHTEFLLKYCKELIPGSGRPLEKLNLLNQSTNFPYITDPDDSLPRSQDPPPVTPEFHEFSTCPTILFLKNF